MKNRFDSQKSFGNLFPWKQLIYEWHSINEILVESRYFIVYVLA